MFTLYARPGSGSAAIEALLEEMGLKWRMELVEEGPDGKPPRAYIEHINPLGLVPSLGLPDGSAMTESAAIMLYLADLQEGFAPAPNHPDRARYLRFMVHLATNTYVSDLLVLYPDRYSTQANAGPGIAQAAKLVLVKDGAVLSKALGDAPYYLGQQFSALDIYAAMIMGWVIQDIPDITIPENLKAHLERVKQRPITGRVFASNKL
jgi:glutathione S-transferase